MTIKNRQWQERVVNEARINPGINPLRQQMRLPSVEMTVFLECGWQL